ncbi:MAG: hypothetical protein GXO79_07840 [Chlorobi bacterium]|nr:hypothetical protein [Chlorobiota bacterium]
MINYKSQTVNVVFSFLIGLTFIVSAVLKLISVDLFELYIYSLQLFSFTISTIIARLIISFEFILGFLYLLSVYKKFARKTIIVTLVLFTFFLIFEFIKGSNENCNCFGEFIKLNPLQSILKNLILLAFVLMSGKSPHFKFKHEIPVFIGILILGLFTPSIISPPDFIYNAIYTSNSEIEIYTGPRLAHFVKNARLDKGKYVVCFFSLKCKYCKLAAHKISAIANRLNCKENIRYIFYGNKNDLEKFWKDSKSNMMKYQFLEPNIFFRISGGRVPVFFLINSGKLQEIYGYRTISEKNVSKFLTNQNITK